MASMPFGLRWRPADAVDEWTEVVPAPVTNRGFVEARRYLFERLRPDCVIHIDDEPLPSVVDSPELATWSPGFFAGEVTGELRDRDGTSHATFLLDVSPDPAKSGREMFGQMLDELWQFDPTLVLGSEPATSLMGELGDQEDPWVAFARLRRYGLAFVRSLEPIRSRPRRGLEVHRDSAPLHNVRRADRQTALAVLRSPAAGLFASHHEAPATPVGLTRLNVPVVRETIDTAINRSMRALIQSVLRRTIDLRNRLQRAVTKETDVATRTGITPRWPVRRQFLEHLETVLVAALRRPPFSLVPIAPVTAAGLTAVAADPMYARAWGLGWRAVRHGVDGAPSSERMWITPSWEIYERWCFARLTVLLEESHPGWNWRRHSGSRHRVAGQRGNFHADLWLQPTFPARSEPGGSRWSISRQREPDIVFTLSGPEGTRFVVLDAKYRVTAANVLDAMASAHIYQDSLRIDSVRPEASFLLVPAGGGVPHLEAEAFQHEHRVGVIPFSAEATSLVPCIDLLMHSCSVQ